MFELSMALKLETILIGDFNIDACPGNLQYMRFQEIFESYGCSNVIDAPTRITPTTQTTLDLCVTSFSPEHIRAGVLMRGLSDHLPRYCLLPHRQPSKSTPVNFIRVYSDQNVQKFVELISGNRWDEVAASADGNTAYETFISTFAQLYDMFPTCEIQKTQKSKEAMDIPGSL